MLEPTAELITFRRSSRVRTAPLIFAPQQKSSKRPRYGALTSLSQG